MNYRIFPLILVTLPILLFATSCERNVLKPRNCGDGQCTYTFLNDQKIDYTSTRTGSSFRIVDGSQRLFTYSFTKEDGMTSAVDGYEEVLYFEVSPDLEDFSFSDNELSSLTMLLSVRECEGCFSSFYLPTKGTVSGKMKNDNTFNIELNVSFSKDSQTKEIDIDDKFRSL